MQIINNLKMSTLKNDNLIQQYFKYHFKYENIFAENTVILMQVGAFFEMYR